MPAMLQALRHYLLAIQFFTSIPVTGRLAAWVGYSPAMLRASAAHFPGVGVVVGTLVAGASWLLLKALPASAFAPLVVAMLGTVLSVMVTGAFHEDGLADIADGLGGSYDRNRALEIMTDSRVGAFGALALVLVVLTKASLLALIGSVDGSQGAQWMVLAIFVAHVVSRTWPLLLIRLMPHVGDAAGSKSKPLADQISTASLWVALLWFFCALAPVFMALLAINFAAVSGRVGMGVLPLVTGILASFVAFLFMWHLLWHRLQGFTGDGLGATQQVCEVALYLGLALAL